MSYCFFTRSTCLSLFALACLGFPHAALAGFQWVAPTPAPTAVAPSSAPSLAPPSPSVAPVLIDKNSLGVPSDSSAPLVISGHAASDAGEAEIPVYKGDVPDFAPSRPDSTSVATSAPAPVASRSAGGDATDVVRGFAKNVPVVVALRQILPAGYTFTIDKNVDMGTLVSFQGGKLWRETLANALVPVGLAMREKGQVVEVGYTGDLGKTSVGGDLVYQPGTAPQSFALPVGASDVASVPAMTVPPLADSLLAPPSPDMALPETWSAERGSSLHKILTDWCRRSHVEFNWVAEYDYPLNASVNFVGSFEDAVRNLLTGFQNASPQPVAELHANAGLGQKVLVVQTRGNTNTD